MMTSSTTSAMVFNSEKSDRRKRKVEVEDGGMRRMDELMNYGNCCTLSCHNYNHPLFLHCCHKELTMLLQKKTKAKSIYTLVPLSFCEIMEKESLIALMTGSTGDENETLKSCGQDICILPFPKSTRRC